jgi:hypothetical protein
MEVSMKNMVGKLVLLYNYRNDGLYRLLRVKSLRDTHSESERLSSKTKFYNQITRGRYLITAEDIDRGAMRSYYISHANNIKEIGFWGLIWHRLMTTMGYRLERGQE